ncbi:MAG: nucleotide-binding protein [Leptospirales bacterium]|nr:nucleotide-binding protein [Leptospirales bacterium]
MAPRKPKTEYEKLIAAGRKLVGDEDDAESMHESFAAWDKRVARWLHKTHAGSGLEAQWSALPYSKLVVGNEFNDSASSWSRFRKVLQERLSWMGNIASKQSGATVLAAHPKTPNQVFIVHGHDDHRKEALARFIEKLDLEAIILHERSSKGQTAFEKLAQNSNVAAAIVLLTGDDLGYSKTAGEKHALPRARQNVILELGYFLAKIGPEKVFALHEEGVEIPSDYAGVIYIRLDPRESWKLEVAKELKELGLAVDLNKIH